MFFNVLNKIDIRELYKPKLFLVIDLLLFAKLLELLAIDYSSSDRRTIFIPRWLKFSHVLVVLQHAWVRTSPQLSGIRRSDLAPFPECQGSCGIVPNGPAGFVFFLLSGFYFTDTDNSQGSRGREGTILFHSTTSTAHEHSDIYLQLCT